MQAESKGKKLIDMTLEESQTYEINGTVIKIEPKFKKSGNTLFSSMSKLILKNSLLEAATV